MPSQQLAPDAESSRDTALGQECRVYERHSCELPSKCQPASAFGKEDLKWPATLENISQGGVCLNLRRRFEPGTGLTIELPSTDTQDAYVVLAKVVHVRRQENGFWFLGCKFISELSEDEMHRLLRAQLQASEAPASKLEITLPQITLPPVPTQANAVAQEEKRDEKRRIGHIHLQLEIAPHTTVGCVIANFAATRSWPLAAGAVGLLKGKDKTGQPWKLKVKVHQCRSAAEGWNLECRLVKAPSELDLLRALGGLVVKI